MAFSRTYDGDEPVRINKWLGQSGVCSRREADALIADGLVSVDGEVVADAGRKPCEITVRRYQAEGVEAPGMQQVHGVDHERNVRRILAGGVGEILLRSDCVS